MDLSLFYFADDSNRQVAQRYELLLQGARFADTHGFTAVWTPERHFHRFGGNYPNPAVTGAAVAAVTERVAVRAGSVVAPLHNPDQIARDWWLINASSNGRAGVSLASGWNRGDFVLNPTRFEDRVRSTMEAVHALRKMRQDGDPGIPLWLSSGGSPETFAAAGRLGVGVLTHLASQSPAVLAQRIQEYRRAFRGSGSPGMGHVTLMLHAYVGQRKSEVEQEIRGPLEEYLMSAMNLMRPADGSRVDAQSQLRLARLAVQPAYEKYMHDCSLIGTVDHALSVAEEFSRIGVDEIACLIDFGLPVEAVLSGLKNLDVLLREMQGRTLC
ncbi:MULTISPECIES: LLM class flavin-dependent oxidoreductase [Streptomyces]|uniref:LLM class flavin-dependent oxidoreductase n=1 Tax=Streptomyces glycanivorans TaxID=3033808 RepID=A0ABY9J6H7_9ACTN|nr:MULTISPECIES: LLM class flavin-dependent oxidoreductase [unclassified Streptomyces]WLQ63427.1 LLM class flavin-dependent oxidoreductase [Streptomyces sp. Alt3]WSR09797.1 LLM class flavin-dependent oxidoreductase [Streptomyces sp. NBC_01208]WSR47479.1 LLM class flavin-dependent oxidoreductase [Streptomyces sp. NBC_01201]